MKQACYDVGEIGRAIELLLVPGSVYELRCLGTKQGTASGYFSDYMELGVAAAQFSGQCDGVYVVLNPVLPRLIHRSPNRMRSWVKKGETSTDEEVIERRWLLIDFDPRRPSGLSATDEEKAHALDRAIAAREYLRERGTRGLVLANSGNGFHLLMPSVEPNDAAAKERSSQILRLLGKQFTDEKVIVDPTTFNAARLCKLYGTMACKGFASPENPHRVSSILEVDEL